MGRSVTVAVPATSANLGPGFDSLGIALDLTGRVTLQTDCPPVSEPVGTAERIILTAARAVYEHTGVPAPAGLQATFEGDIPVGRGLGA
ncbi:MAG TPA: homoserine kinase, partial [Dehalococcoidia bacterium]|nr:homoserine kinase [Dehalococcoidia bacterium]